MASPRAHTDEANNPSQNDNRQREHWLELRIFAPRDPEERVFVFDNATPVGKAAGEVAAAFGYASGNHTFQTRDDHVLDRGLTLAEAGVHNHELIELVDVGGGV